MQAPSPLRRTPEPVRDHHSHHSTAGRDDDVKSRLYTEAAELCVSEGQPAGQADHVPVWVSTATASTASWQLPPGTAAEPLRSPRLRSAALSPGPLRFSYREAAAASAARRAAGRRAQAVSADETPLSRKLSLALPALERSDASPERRERRVCAGQQVSGEDTLHRAPASAAVAYDCGDGDDDVSPVSLRKRFGGFQSCESLPGDWLHRDGAAR